MSLETATGRAASKPGLTFGVSSLRVQINHSGAAWTAVGQLRRGSHRLASVGFFGRYVFDGRTWHDVDPGSGQELDIEAPWLSVDIYDSDFATVRYEPPGPGSGTAYLGNTPRTYFDAESASVPADVPREAEGLACWIGQQQGSVVSAELRELIASFLASDGRAERRWAGAGLDDADIFVEIKVSRFLLAVGFPLPQDLPRS